MTNKTTVQITKDNIEQFDIKIGTILKDNEGMYWRITDVNDFTAGMRVCDKDGNEIENFVGNAGRSVFGGGLSDLLNDGVATYFIETEQPEIKEEKNYNFFVKDTAEFEQFADFESITNLTAEEAVSKFYELQKKGFSSGIGINIPNDIVFDDSKGIGSTIVVIDEEKKANFSIFGDSFIKNVNTETNSDTLKTRISAYEELYNKLTEQNIPTEYPQFVFEKKTELEKKLESQNYVIHDETVSTSEIEEEKLSIQKKIQQLKDELNNPDVNNPADDQYISETKEYIERLENMTDEDFKNLATEKKEQQKKNKESHSRVVEQMAAEKQSREIPQEGELLSYNETHLTYSVTNKKTNEQTSIQPRGRLEENVKKLGKLSSLTEARNAIERIKSSGFEILSTESRVVIFNEDKFYDFDSASSYFNYTTNKFEHNSDARTLNGWDFKDYIKGGLKITKRMKAFEKIESKTAGQENENKLNESEIANKEENLQSNSNSVKQENKETETEKNNIELSELQSVLKDALKQVAVPLEKIEFTKENYNKLFPRSRIETPIENVKMGANQFEKLEAKERQNLLLAVHDTLKNPDLIINEQKENVFGENEDNHIYAKSFLIDDKVHGVQSVVVSIDGESISISTHERSINNIVNKIKKPDQLLYAAAKVRLLVEQHTEIPQSVVNPIRENGYVASPQPNLQQNSESVNEEKTPAIYFNDLSPEQKEEVINGYRSADDQDMLTEWENILWENLVQIKKDNPFISSFDIEKEISVAANPPSDEWISEYLQKNKVNFNTDFWQDIFAEMEAKPELKTYHTLKESDVKDLEISSVSLEEILSVMEMKPEVTSEGKIKIYDQQRQEYIDNRSLFSDSDDDNWSFYNAAEIFERLDIYINDYFISDFEEQLEAGGVTLTGNETLKDLCDYAKEQLEAGITTISQDELNLAMGIVNPDTLIMPEGFIEQKKTTTFSLQNQKESLAKEEQMIFNDAMEKYNPDFKNSVPENIKTEQNTTLEQCNKIIEKYTNTHFTEQEQKVVNEYEKEDANRHQVLMSLCNMQYIHCTTKNKYGYWEINKGKEISANEVRRLMSCDDFASGVDRASFHITAGRTANDGSFIYFNDSERKRDIQPYELSKEDIELLSKYEEAGGLKENIPKSVLEQLSKRNNDLTSDDLKNARALLPKEQYQVVLGYTQGEEGEHFKNIIKEISSKAEAIKGKREILTENEKHPLAFKYTIGASSFYFSEWDGEDELFGYAVLNGDTQNSEWGYTSLEELKNASGKDINGFPMMPEMIFYGLEDTIEKQISVDYPVLSEKMGFAPKLNHNEELISEFGKEIFETLQSRKLEQNVYNICCAAQFVIRTMNSSEQKEIFSIMKRCGCEGKNGKSNTEDFLTEVVKAENNTASSVYDRKRLYEKINKSCSLKKLEAKKTIRTPERGYDREI